MPITPSVEDFKIITAVCEVRYQDAYLLFDHTGRICEEMRNSFSSVRVNSASPNNTIFQAEEGGFGLELGQSRFSSSKNLDKRLEKFGEYSKRFFDCVTTYLAIKVFTRIGLRVNFRMEYPDLDKAMAALTSLKLTTLPATQRCGASSEPMEIMLRWQSDQIGALLHLKAEKGSIDVILPPELELEKPEIHKSITGLLIDVDYYTVAPVEKSQWDASAWITQSMKTIKKDVDLILAG